jgi:hypothetical protein
MHSLNAPTELKEAARQGSTIVFLIMVQVTEPTLRCYKSDELRLPRLSFDILHRTCVGATRPTRPCSHEYGDGGNGKRASWVFLRQRVFK